MSGTIARLLNGCEVTEPGCYFRRLEGDTGDTFRLCEIEWDEERKCCVTHRGIELFRFPEREYYGPVHDPRKGDS